MTNNRQGGDGYAIDGGLDGREDMLWSDRSFRIIVRQLVNIHDLPVMGEHQELEDGRSNGSHCIHLTTSKEKVVIDLGIDNLDVNQHIFSG